MISVVLVVMMVVVMIVVMIVVIVVIVIVVVVVEVLRAGSGRRFLMGDRDDRWDGWVVTVLVVLMGVG